MNRHERRKAKAKTGWVPLEQYVLTRTKAEIDAMVRDLAAHFPNKSEDEHRRSILNGMGELDDYWRNDQYAVHVIRWRGQGPGRRVCSPPTPRPRPYPPTIAGPGPST